MYDSIFEELQIMRAPWLPGKKKKNQPNRYVYIWASLRQMK